MSGDDYCFFYWKITTSLKKHFLQEQRDYFFKSVIITPILNYKLGNIVICLSSSQLL